MLLPLLSLLQMPMNVLALADAMESLAFPDTTVDLVADLFGLQDSVTLADLRAAVHVATLPGRDLIRLRRALDPAVRALRLSVCVWQPKRARGFTLLLTVAVILCSTPPPRLWPCSFLYTRPVMTSCFPSSSWLPRLCLHGVGPIPCLAAHCGGASQGSSSYRVTAPC